LSAASLRAEVRTTEGILARAEAVRREWRDVLAAKRMPSAPGLLGAFAGRVLTEGAPILLVLHATLVGSARLASRSAGQEVEQLAWFSATLLLHGMTLVPLARGGPEATGAFEILRTPSRRSLFLARALRILPRSLAVGMAWATFLVIANPGPWLEPEYGCSLLGVLLVPISFVSVRAWRRIRDPGGPECTMSAGLYRMVLGGFAFLPSYLAFQSGLAKPGSPRIVLPAIGGIVGVLMILLGGKSVLDSILDGRRRGFRILSLLADLVTPVFAGLCLVGSTVLAASAMWGPSDLQRLLHLWGHPGASVAAIFAVLGILWSAGFREFVEREVPTPRVFRPEVVSPAGLESRLRPARWLLRWPRPRGFWSACVYRERVTFAPVLLLVLAGFITCWTWVALLEPNVCFVVVLGTLIFPALTGVDVSERLHLLGVEYRDQHLQNLRALLRNVALPVALLFAIGLATLPGVRAAGPTMGLAGAALVLRAGLLGPWRILRNAGLRFPFGAVVAVAAALPFVVAAVLALASVPAPFELSTASLTCCYLALGLPGLAWHLATLREPRLREEMRRRACRN
jgi:hypothetical protein